MNDTKKRHLVRIQIDGETYESLDPTTGAALYELGGIPENRDLYQEVNGNHDDIEIPRDGTVIDLKQNDHFYSQKEITIIVNGEKKQTGETRLSFDQVAKIAYPVPPPGENIMYTILYRKGPPANPKGTLTEGNSVKLKNGMIFDVTPTDKS